MSLLSVAVSGDVERYQRDEVTLMRNANLYALAVASQTLRDRLGSQTSGALGPRLARAWKQRLYRNPKDPAALVYTRAPDIISTFLADTVIVPKKGKYLAVPTGFNRESGRRGGKVRVTPKQMIASGMSFTRPRKNGPGLIWFLQVAQAQDRTKSGRVRDLAMAGAMVSVGAVRRRNVRKSEVSSKDVIKARAVPMFILLPQARHTRRLDAQAEVDRIEQEIPGYLAEGFEFYDTGSST